MFKRTGLDSQVLLLSNLTGDLFTCGHAYGQILIYFVILLCRTKWVKVYGTVYKTPCALVVGMEHGVTPRFGCLQEIFVEKEEILFQVKYMIPLPLLNITIHFSLSLHMK